MTALLKTVVGLVGIGVGALIGVAVTGSEDNPVAYIFPLIGLCIAGVFLRVLGIDKSGRGRKPSGRTQYPIGGYSGSSDCGSGYSGSGDCGGGGGDGGGC